MPAATLYVDMKALCISWKLAWRYARMEPTLAASGLLFIVIFSIS